MKTVKLFAMSLLAAAACLMVVAAFEATPSSASVSDNWTLPYNQSWGKCSCTQSENLTRGNNSSVCAGAWGDSHCIAPGR